MSTGEQARSGLGLEAQRAAIDAAAKRLKLVLVGVEADEGLSGDLPARERPGFLAQMNRVKRGDVVLVAKRDRLGRDPAENAIVERALLERKVTVVSAAGEGTEGDDPQHVLMRWIVDAMAQYERSMAAQRTKAALRAKRARGEAAGNVPFGYSLGPDRRRLVPNAAELSIVAAVLKAAAEGKTHRQIVATLHGAGVVSPRSKKPLRLTQVQRILKRENK